MAGKKGDNQPEKKAPQNSGEKKRIAIDYEKASPDVLKAIKEKYPNGVEGGLIKFVKGDQTYYAISVETADAIYLVKIKRNAKGGAYDDDDDDESSAPESGFEADTGDEEEEEEDTYDQPEEDDGEDED